MTTRLLTNLIVIHCAATDDSQDIGAAEIDRWHKQRGFDRIGYHFVIRRNGRIEKGRGLYDRGAHAGGHDRKAVGDMAVAYNDRSIGICMVGGVEADDDMKARDNFTVEQWATLRALVETMLTIFPSAQVIGHREIAIVPKACPSFDVQAWKIKVGIG